MRRLREVRRFCASTEPMSARSAEHRLCVSDSTPRSYLHASGTVFITAAVIHRTANEKQQAGPEQASPLHTHTRIHMFGMCQNG